MVKEVKNNSAAQQSAQTQGGNANAEGAQERPNRAAYAKMYAEDYPGADFEDKEARYGNLINDRKHLREYTEAGRGLSDIMDKHQWLGAMINELRENPDQDPFTWMASNGIDIQQAMESEEYRSKIAELLAEHAKKQADAKAHDAEVSDNLENNAAANLQKVQQKYGFDDDTASQMFRDLFEKVADPAFNGEVSEEVWDMIYKGMHYDEDVASAREQGGMQARNEKMQNPVKKFDSNMPPSLSQAGNGRAKKEEKQPNFFDDLKDYH
jgi:hypothetical protein